jgi:hypothetical protein
VTYTEQDVQRILKDAIQCLAPIVRTGRLSQGGEQRGNLLDVVDVHTKLTSLLAPFEQKDGEVVLFRWMQHEKEVTTYATYPESKATCCYCSESDRKWHRAFPSGDSNNSEWRHPEMVRLTPAESAAFLKAHPIPSDLLAQLTGKPVEFVDKWPSNKVWKDDGKGRVEWQGKHWIECGENVCLLYRNGGISIFPKDKLFMGGMVELHGPAKSAVIESALKAKPDLFTKTAPKSAVDEAWERYEQARDFSPNSTAKLDALKVAVRAIVRDEMNGGAK